MMGGYFEFFDVPAKAMGSFIFPSPCPAVVISAEEGTSFLAVRLGAGEGGGVGVLSGVGGDVGTVSRVGGPVLR